MVWYIHLATSCDAEIRAGAWREPIKRVKAQLTKLTFAYLHNLFKSPIYTRENRYNMSLTVMYPRLIQLNSCFVLFDVCSFVHIH